MKDFLAIGELTSKEFQGLLDKSARLKAEWRRKGNRPFLKNRTLGMVFQKPSLRTRVSFDTAMLHLGGHALYLSPQEIGLGQRESIADVARVLSRYVDAIMARVFAHSHVAELAQYARVPVINGLSDWEHPCQALADVFTIWEKKKRLRGLKVAYVGDGNNVARSLMFACALAGMTFLAASPIGYALDEASLEHARAMAKKTRGAIELIQDPVTACDQADVLYTDVWASMGEEDEAAARAKIFPPYQLNENLLRHAKKDALVLHCLPAHRGQEIAAEVIDGKNSVVFDQAENRLHAQKGILVRLMSQ